MGLRWSSRMQTDESLDDLPVTQTELDEPETLVTRPEEDSLDHDVNDRLSIISKPQEFLRHHWSYQSKVRLQDGREGIVTGYDAPSDSYSILLDSATKAMSISQDGFLFNDGCESEEEDNVDIEILLSPSQLTALNLARSFFIPGSHFIGTIAIPGFQQYAETERQTYAFHVTRKSRDEFGKPIVLARHSAYGDEQSCHLHIGCSSASGSDAPIVTASWEDGETICEGMVDLSSAMEGKCAVRGDVKQLVQGEKGFYERASKVTHTFELFRVTTCKAEARYNVLLAQAQCARVAELSSGFWVGRQATGNLERLRGLDLPWREIVLQDACRYCEDECATLRRYSSMLDELQFEHRESKEATLKSFSVVGINRASRHAEIDQRLLALNMVIFAAAQLLPAVEEDIPYTRLKAQHRLSENFQRFDQSIRAAEGRIPLDMLECWRRQGNETVGMFCSICSIETSGGDAFAELPCGHWYHFNCVKDWLHAHRTCPNCRKDLSVDSSA